MRRAIFLSLLFFLISGCGDLAPNDAVIEGPADRTETLATAAGGSTLSYYPLDFIAKNASGDVLAEIEMEFFQNGTLGEITLLDAGGNALTVSTFKTMTDERGTARVGFTMIVPGCGGGTVDIVTSGGIFVTVKSESFQWTVTATRTCTT